MVAILLFVVRIQLSVVKNTKTIMRINNGYDGHNVLAPTRYYAHPFYSCAYNMSGDGAADNPATTQKTAINLLNWRYVQKDDTLIAFNALCI